METPTVDARADPTIDATVEVTARPPVQATADDLRGDDHCCAGCTATLKEWKQTHGGRCQFCDMDLEEDDAEHVEIAAPQMIQFGLPTLNACTDCWCWRVCQGCGQGPRGEATIWYPKDRVRCTGCLRELGMTCGCQPTCPVCRALQPSG